MAGAMCAAQVHATNLTIGALFPMSGLNASYGDIFSSGANLARDHINADNLLGGKLSIQYEDSQALPQRGVIGMNKLVNVQSTLRPVGVYRRVQSDLDRLGPHQDSCCQRRWRRSGPG